MKTSVVATCAAIGLLAGATTVAADPPPGPQDPCAHNPTTLCDGNINITNEPPGENCETGGIKIVLQHGKKDGTEEPEPVQLAQGYEPKEPEQPKTPKEDPPDETFFVCNGLPGPPGPPGPPGANGTNGANGSTPTPTTSASAAGTRSSSSPRKCFSSARLAVRFILPARLADFNSLRLVIRGPNTTKIRFNKIMLVRTAKNGKRFVFVPLRARNCGRYIVTLNGPANVKPLAGQWTITGGFGLKRRQIQLG